MGASGLPGIHAIPLGSHLCAFYRTPKELLRMTASFVSAGLTDNELCVWVLPTPVTIPLALAELSRHGLDGQWLQATKQLQIVSADDYWFSTTPFDVERSLMRLVSVSTLADQLGYTSVRMVGGPGPFLSDGTRQAFMRYEQEVTAIIAEHPCIGLCCYPSAPGVATQMFDIMSTHPGALVRTHAGWATI
ncbi:MAG: MEDS domain-containing protein [Nitrospira sp.]